MMSALTFLVIIIVMMVVMMLMVMFKLQLVLKCLGVAHSTENHGAFYLIPRCGYNRRLMIFLPDELNRLVKFVSGNILSPRKYDTPCGLHLVVEEFAEILHIHFSLLGVNNRSSRRNLNTCLIGNIKNGSFHIRQLPYPRRLNDDPVGMIFINNLFKRRCKIAHKRAAYTAAVHLRNIDPGIL